MNKTEIYEVNWRPVASIGVRVDRTTITPDAEVDLIEQLAKSIARAAQMPYQQVWIDSYKLVGYEAATANAPSDVIVKADVRKTQGLTLREALFEIASAPERFAITRIWWGDGVRVMLRLGSFNYAAADEEAGDLGTFLGVDSAPVLKSVFGVSPAFFQNCEDKNNSAPLLLWHNTLTGFIEAYTVTVVDLLADDYRIVEFSL